MSMMMMMMMMMMTKTTMLIRRMRWRRMMTRMNAEMMIIKISGYGIGFSAPSLGQVV